MQVDRAYALGSSGGNGWQRLFEGTSWVHAFDSKQNKGYSALGNNSEGSSERTSLELEMDEDLESGWAKEAGVTVSNR